MFVCIDLNIFDFIETSHKVVPITLLISISRHVFNSLIKKRGQLLTYVKKQRYKVIG